jgi:hypothetical protein
VPSTTSIPQLRAALNGRVITPDDTGYDQAVRVAWVEAFAAALRQGDAGAYVGFLAEEDQARVRQAYPGRTWERLAAIKARYDPTNLFHLDQNIPPTNGDADGEVSAAGNRDLMADEGGAC